MSRRLFIAFFVPLGILLAVVAFFSLQWRMAHDSAIMLYVAFLVDRFGRVPYRDDFVVSSQRIGCAGTEQPPTSTTIPYSSANPVLGDNDASTDVYTDEYLMSLSSAGNINLRGLITTGTLNGFTVHADVVEFISDRNAVRTAATNSGFHNVPGQFEAEANELVEPGNSQIDSTTPTSTVGSSKIIAEAALASSLNPLVIVVGGPLTTVANAYLLDQSIASKVIVAYFGCRTATSCNDYNSWSDPWAAWIVLSRLTTVVWGSLENTGVIQTPKAQILSTLPASPLRTYMYNKIQVSTGEPTCCDYDSPPAIQLMLPTYAMTVTRSVVSTRVMSSGQPSPQKLVPTMTPNASGNLYVVSVGNSNAGTSEWFRALTNPAAYQATPTAPLNPAVVQITSTTHVRFTWNDNSADETGFTVQRAVGGGAFADLVTKAANAVSHDDTTTSAGTLYRYRVAAVNLGGTSVYTAEVSITPVSASPPAPTLTSCTPDTGVRAQSFGYSCTGTNFQTGAVLTASGADVTLTGCFVSTSTTIGCTISIGASAATTARNITVTNPDTQNATINSEFTVQAVSGMSRSTHVAVIPRLGSVNK